VAERVASIADADTILVLEEGRVTAQGSHDALLAGSPAYRDIAASQLILADSL